MSNDIKFKKNRSKELAELLKYSTEIKFTVPESVLSYIVEPLTNLRYNDTVILKISKELDDENFLINVKLKDE